MGGLSLLVFQLEPKRNKAQKAIILMQYSSGAQSTVIERVLLPTKDFTNGLETKREKEEKDAKDEQKRKVYKKGQRPSLGHF